MESIKFQENNNYQDYVASYFFRSLGLEDVKFTTKVVDVKDEKVILIEVTGVQPSDGKKIVYTLWPRNKATEGDLAKLKQYPVDFDFRIGFYTNPETGEVTASAPKHLLATGEKREFVAE